MRRLPEFFRSLIVTAFVLLVLSPAGASAKKDECPWGYEQTMMLQHDRWSSLKLFEEFHSFDRKSLPPNCRKRVGYLYATVLKTIKNRAPFLRTGIPKPHRLSVTDRYPRPYPPPGPSRARGHRRFESLTGSKAQLRASADWPIFDLRLRGQPSGAGMPSPIRRWAIVIQLEGSGCRQLRRLAR